MSRRRAAGRSKAGTCRTAVTGTTLRGSRSSTRSSGSSAGWWDGDRALKYLGCVNLLPHVANGGFARARLPATVRVYAAQRWRIDGGGRRDDDAASSYSDRIVAKTPSASSP